MSTAKLQLGMFCALSLVAIFILIGCKNDFGESCDLQTSDHSSPGTVEIENPDCESEICVSDTLGGYCSEECGADEDCPELTTCNELTIGPPFPASVCMYE